MLTWDTLKTAFKSCLGRVRSALTFALLPLFRPWPPHTSGLLLTEQARLSLPPETDPEDRYYEAQRRQRAKPFLQVESHADVGWAGGPAGGHLPHRVRKQLGPEHAAWSAALLWPVCCHRDLCLSQSLPEDRVGGWWSPKSPELKQGLCAE